MRARIRGWWSFPSKQPLLPVLRIHGMVRWQPRSCRHPGQGQEHSRAFIYPVLHLGCGSYLSFMALSMWWGEDVPCIA